VRLISASVTIVIVRSVRKRLDWSRRSRRWISGISVRLRYIRRVVLRYEVLRMRMFVHGGITYTYLKRTLTAHVHTLFCVCACKKHKARGITVRLRYIRRVVLRYVVLRMCMFVHGGITYTYLKRTHTAHANTLFCVCACKEHVCTFVFDCVYVCVCVYLCMWVPHQSMQRHVSILNDALEAPLFTLEDISN
jgi:hypothetical protein